MTYYIPFELILIGLHCHALCIMYFTKTILSLNLTISIPSVQVLDYDFYGQYENDKHQNYPYSEKLTMDYTFNFPEHQSLVSNNYFTTLNTETVVSSFFIRREV